MNRFGRLLRGLALLVAVSGVAFAQDDVPTDSGKSRGAAPGSTEPPAPIYEAKLLRLSEILGSLSFLRDLCGDSDGSAWRSDMSDLLASEDPPPQRRARLIARFNHGYETFNAVYRTCTPSARLAIARYLAEGQSLASEVRGRYSQ